MVEKIEEGSKKKSFLGNVVGKVGAGLKIAGKVTVYLLDPRHWPRRSGRIQHDVKNVVRSVQNKEQKPYDPPIKLEKDSKKLGIQVINQGKGEVSFVASRTFMWDISQISDEQIEQIKELNNDYLKITVEPKENRVTITIDVEKIINDIKADPKNEGKSPEEIKNLAIGRIIKQVDGSLKEIAKITGGELDKYADLKLIRGIAEKLYREYDAEKQQKVSSEHAVPQKNPQGEEKAVKRTDQELSESLMQTEQVKKMQTEGNMTNPNQMYCSKENIAKAPVKESSEAIEKQPSIPGHIIDNLRGKISLGSNGTSNTPNDREVGGGRGRV